MKSRIFVTLIFSLIWIAVIIPKEWFSLFSAGLLIIGLLLTRKIKMTDQIKWLICIVVVHIVAILYYLYVNKNIDSRVFAGINTVYCWIAAICVYSIIVKGSKGSIKGLVTKGIENIIYVNLFILFLLACIGICFQKLGLSSITLFDKPLYYREWSGNSVGYRAQLFFDYCSLITAFALLMLGLLLRSGLNGVKLFALLLTIIPVFASKSRICIAAYSLFAIIVIGSNIQKKLRNYKKMTIVALILGSIALLFLSGIVAEKVLNIIFSRAGSTIRRLNLYITSIRTMWQHNPIIGVGVKKLYVEAIPLGSHSTYVGILYKTGIVGVLLSIQWFRKIFANTFRRKNPVDIAMLLAFLIIFLLEDADGTNWLTFYLFAYLGIVERETYSKVFIRKKRFANNVQQVIFQ